jgi:hypothetical protein
MSEEAVKPAFMRRKVNQGRNTESQNKEWGLQEHLK